MHPNPPVVVIGELNPYGTDPRYALYDEPHNSAGSVLRRRVFAVPRRVYFDSHLFVRGNICTGVWNLTAARDRVKLVRAEYPESTYILLGRKVSSAFGYSGTLIAQSGNYVILPHPSGRNTMWNDPQVVQDVRTLLCTAIPWIPWGSEASPAVPEIPTKYLE